jgi:hypothetical protein
MFFRVFCDFPAKNPVFPAENTHFGFEHHEFACICGVSWAVIDPEIDRRR